MSHSTPDGGKVRTADASADQSAVRVCACMCVRERQRDGWKKKKATVVRDRDGWAVESPTSFTFNGLSSKR